MHPATWRLLCGHMQGLQSAGGVAEAFRKHVPVLAELAIAATSGDVAQSARQKEALKDTCVCIEQLAQVANSLAKSFMTDLCFLCHLLCRACLRSTCSTCMLVADVHKFQHQPVGAGHNCLTLFNYTSPCRHVCGRCQPCVMTACVAKYRCTPARACKM